MNIELVAKMLEITGRALNKAYPTIGKVSPKAAIVVKVVASVALAGVVVIECVTTVKEITEAA